MATAKSPKAHLTALKPFSISSLRWSSRQLLVVQIGVRPGMRADGMTCGGNLLENFGIIGRVLADRKENAGRAFLCQRLQDRGRVDRPRTIIEGQHHFMVAQEIELLEMLETETRSARGVDLNGAADPKRIGICAGGFRRGGSRPESAGGAACGAAALFGARRLRPRRA